MKSHDIVVNTVGPFYQFEVPIIKAIIEAQKPFLDICDDWKPTLDALEFDEEERLREKLERLEQNSLLLGFMGFENVKLIKNSYTKIKKRNK